MLQINITAEMGVFLLCLKSKKNDFSILYCYQGLIIEASNEPNLNINILLFYVVYLHLLSMIKQTINHCCWTGEKVLKCIFKLCSKEETDQCDQVAGLFFQYLAI